MMDQRTIAEAYLYALELGLADTEEIMRWADEVILKTSEPPFVYLEIASSGGCPEKLMSELPRIPGVIAPRRRSRFIFGLMARALEREASLLARVVRGLFWMAVDDNCPSAEAASRVYGVEHEWEMTLAHGVRPPSRLLQKVRDLLSEFGEAIPSRSD